MFEENNEVDNSAETTTQADYESNDSNDESTDQGQATETNESGESRKTETPEQRRARIKRMYEREFGKSDDKGAKEGKGSDAEGSKESSKEGDDRYARLELKTEGVTSKKAQDIVLEYANWKGIDPVDALKNPIVKAELAELEKKTSAPAPSKRTTTGSSDDFAYWVAQAKKGNFPRHDKSMMERLAKARIW